MKDLPWVGSQETATLISPAAASKLQDPSAPLPWAQKAPIISALGLISVDVGAAAVAAACGLELRNIVWGPMSYPLGLVEIGGAWILMRFWAGLYPGFGLSPVEELQRSTTTTGIAAMAHAAALFGLQAAAVSRFTVLVTWVMLMIASWALRGACKALLIRFNMFGAPVIIAGAGASGARLVMELRSNPGLGFVPVAFFDDDPAKLARTVEGVPVIGPIQTSLNAHFPYPVRYAIIAIPALGGQKLARFARLLSTRYMNLGVMGDLFGFVDLSLRPRSLGYHLALEVRNNLLDPLNMRLKRIIDLLVAIPLALLALPATLVATLVVKLVSPGPAFFIQEREGLGGRRVRIWKIRTMVPNADELLEKYLAENEAARAEWARYMKLRDDPRVVPVVGHFLRRCCIDELPQLWNVLKGELSLVGPRPFPHYHLAQFPEEFLGLRRQALPGMTGLWQITSRSEGDLEEQEQTDAYYIRNWTLWIDLWIMLRTTRAVLAGRGAR